MFYLFSGDIAARLLGFAATAYLARILGKSGFGAINIGMAVLAYTMIVGNFGLTLLGTKKVAASNESIEELTGRILSARLLLVSIAYIVIYILVKLLNISEEIGAVILAYQFFLFPAVFLLEWFFQGQQKMGVVAAGRSVGMLFYLAFLIIFVTQTDDTVMTARGWVLGGIANTLFLWLIFRRNKYTVAFNWKRLKLYPLLKEAFPLGVASLISQVVLQFPVIYLGWVASTEEAGVFSAAFKMIVLLLIFDRVFYNVFFPAISRCAHQSPERLEEIVNRILRIVTVSALTVGLAAVISAALLITIVFGTSFKEAIPLFQGMVGYFFFTLVNSVIGFTLVGMGREKEFTRAIITGLIVFFIAVILVPRPYSAIGVVAALNLYQLVILIALAAKLKSHIHLSLARNLVIPFLIAFLVFLPLLIFAGVTLPVKLAAIIIICFPLIAWSGGICRDDINYLKKVFI